MRTFAIALAGLVAVSHALPARDAAGLEERQSSPFVIGEPGLLAPSTGPMVPETQPDPETTFKVGRRDVFWIPSSSKTEKDNIEKAELELQDAQQQLAETHSRRERASLQRYIKSLERYLKEKAGIVKITSPPGTTTTFTPGKRTDNIFVLAGTYSRLAHQYTDKHPSPEVYAVLCKLKAILSEAHALPGDIIFLGPATSEFGISTKRDMWIGGSCDSDEVIGLLLTYASLQAISGGNPSPQLKSLESAVLARLRSCNADPTVGGITPDPTVPGAPLVPNKPAPGAPMVPNKPSTGAPLVPNDPKTGAPLTPST